MELYLQTSTRLHGAVPNQLSTLRHVPGEGTRSDGGRSDKEELGRVRKEAVVADRNAVGTEQTMKNVSEQSLVSHQTTESNILEIQACIASNTPGQPVGHYNTEGTPLTAIHVRTSKRTQLQSKCNELMPLLQPQRQPKGRPMTARTLEMAIEIRILVRHCPLQQEQ